jgi:hypothetical protein
MEIRPQLTGIWREPAAGQAPSASRAPLCSWLRRPLPLPSCSVKTSQRSLETCCICTKQMSGALFRTCVILLLFRYFAQLRWQVEQRCVFFSFFVLSI